MVKTRVAADKKSFLPCEIYLDGYLKTALEDFWIRVKKDWDGIFWVVGREGDGKSVLAMIIGLFLDNRFCLKNIVFNLEQLEKAIDEAEPFTYIQYDEADEGTGVRGKLESFLKRKFKVIRDKNLFIGLVTPTFFDRGKYFAIHRTEFLIHVFSMNLERGWFRFFNWERKKSLYIRGKKEWDMGCVKANIGEKATSVFTKLPVGFPIDEVLYKKAKHEGTMTSIDVDETPKQLEISFRRRALLRLDRLRELKGFKLTQKDLGWVFGIDQGLVSKELKVVYSDIQKYDYEE